MKTPYFTLFLLAILTSCSTDMPGQNTNDDLLEASNEEIVEEVVIEVDEDIYSEIEEIEKSSEFSRLDTIYDSSDSLVAHNTQVKKDIIQILTQDFDEYTVEKGDSLMLISYKVLGDYRKWKMLRKWNPELASTESTIRPGQVIKYDTSYVEEKGLSRGYPYLILSGDTLKRISHKVYEDRGRHWKSIYNNNRDLIYDPNVIFAGFTLYYLPLSDLAENRIPANQ